MMHDENLLKFQFLMENRLNIAQNQTGDFPQQMEFEPVKIFKVEGAVSDTENRIFIDLELLRQYAAVTGHFTPIFLLSRAGIRKDDFLLGMLFKDCDIQKTDQIKWILKSSVRKICLEKMITDKILGQRIFPPSDQADLYAHWLFNILFQRERINLEVLDRENLLEITNVLESIGPLPLNYLPPIEEIQNRLQSLSFLDEYYPIAPNFVGRKKELSQLDAFLYKTTKNLLWEAIIITGQGGSGKSTLLSKFCRSVIENQDFTLCILDFDRPGIDARDQVWLEEEISRQIGLQMPAFNTQLRELRNENRDNSSMYRNYNQSLESANSKVISSSLLYLVREIMIKERPNQPLVIVLDTLEEVDEQNQWEVMLKWLDFSADVLYPINLKVILSGRIYDVDLPNAQTILDLADFSQIDAIEFLSREGFERKDSMRLLRPGVIPKRPLELRLVSRMIKQNQTSIEEFVEDMQSTPSEKVQENYFMGSLYKRVLGRIAEPLVRKIAYPGLILRFVNTEIIQYILAEVLDLGHVDETKAQALANSLQNYAWIAYRGLNGEIWHRRDLRRIMIRQMLVDEPDTVRVIQERAIKFFTNKGTEKGLAEALYHRLMLNGEGNDYLPSLEQLNSLQSYLQNDITDLPKRSQALLRFARQEEMDLKYIDLLPDEIFSRAYHATGKALVAKNQLEKAYSLYELKQQRGLQIDIIPNTLLDNWEIETLFNIGKFTEIPPVQSQAIHSTNPAVGLTSLIFPHALINADPLDLVLFESLIEKIPEQFIEWVRAFNGSDGLSLINRIAFSLTLINDHMPFSKVVRSGLDELFKAAVYDYKPCVVDNSLYLIYLLGNKTEKFSFRLGVENFRLDKQWLGGLSDLIEEEKRYLIEKIVKTIDNSTSQHMFAKQVLSALDGDLEKSIQEVSVDTSLLNAFQKQYLLTGTNWLFRTPAKSVLYQLIKDKMEPHILRDAALLSTNFFPADLDKENYKVRRRGRVDFLEPLIELIDRSWNLEFLVNRIKEQWGGSAQLGRLSKLMGVWSEARERLIRSADNESE